MMTIGRWMYALGVMLCIFQTEAIVASELLAVARDGLFLFAIVLVWREDEGSRLVEAGWLALTAAWIGMAGNGTPLTVLMVFVAFAMLLGGYRLRWLPRYEGTA